MATVHSQISVSLTNKFALLDESDPFRDQHPSPPSLLEDRSGLSNISNVIDTLSRSALANPSDDTHDGDAAWHVKENRRKKSISNASPSTAPTRASQEEPSDDNDGSEYDYYYDDNEEEGVHSFGGSASSVITPTNEHELSKSARAVNRKNIRLAEKHGRKVTEIKTNQKTRADNLESRERRKNPPPPFIPLK